MGPRGPGAEAAASHSRARELVAALTAVKGVRRALRGRFSTSRFVVRSAGGAHPTSLAGQGILGGLDLAELYPELGYALLVLRGTETEDAKRYQ